jgi:hypothetical protein
VPFKPSKVRVLCAICGEPQPRVRVPKSFRQAMTDGTTCAKCGTELGRTGNSRLRPESNE